MSNGLGRGLSSLIPQKVKKIATTSASEAVVNLASEADKGKVLELKPEQIGLNPSQPRKNFNEHQMQELVDSIKRYGVIQPLIVTPRNGAYELIAGERRLRS